MKRADVASLASLPRLPGWLTPLMLIIAFAVGWSLVGVGQEREINLLSLPLVGLLLWNIAVIAISLLAGMKKHTDQSPPAWLFWALQKLSSTSSAPQDPTLAAAAIRFRESAASPALARATCLAKTLLHSGAAMVALGSITAMYAHGWSHEYRAVWESTLLSEQSAATFLRWVFAPASAITGLSIPLADLPAMHRTLEAAPQHSGEALPWIHLYAVTLALGIILPRILFAVFERLRAGRVIAQALKAPEWSRYANQLINDAAPRGDAIARLLIHAPGLHEAAIARWQNGVLACWRGVGQVNVTRIASGEEDEFAQSWQPDSDWLALAFSLATTPEEEVQGGLIRSAIARLHELRPQARAILILDATPFESRWKGMADLEPRLMEKAALWKRITADIQLEVHLLRAAGPVLI